jgi:hypothetical protein
MSNPINSVTQAPPPQPTSQAPTAAPKASASATQQTPIDSVTISHSAQTILQEVQETHSQTVREASGGDSQARRLLAKEAASTIPPKA